MSFWKNTIYYQIPNPGFSWETALLKINDDILRASDRGMVTALVSLDYNKAFDTVKHDILLEVLADIGFGHEAMSLMNSYLSSRSQRVRVAADISEPLGLVFGGSCSLAFTAAV